VEEGAQRHEEGAAFQRQRLAASYLSLMACCGDISGDKNDVRGERYARLSRYHITGRQSEREREEAHLSIIRHLVTYTVASTRVYVLCGGMRLL